MTPEKTKKQGPVKDDVEIKKQGKVKAAVESKEVKQEPTQPAVVVKTLTLDDVGKQTTQLEKANSKLHDEITQLRGTILSQIHALEKAAKEEHDNVTQLRKGIPIQIKKAVFVTDAERQLAFGDGFRAGIRHIVDVAESFILADNNVKDRGELYNKALMPTFWTRTLVQCLHDTTPVWKPTVAKPVKEQDEEPDEKEFEKQFGIASKTRP